MEPETVPPPILDMQGITKRFGYTLANDRVDFKLATGEIHALLGENGAGKTTLMNVLYGLYGPDAGEIMIEGRAAMIRNPRDAIAHGIGMVHQHFMLLGPFTAAENVFLGTWKRGELLMDPRKIQDQVKQAAHRYGLEFDTSALVSTLPVGTQQRIEILKALFRGARILILDEPTAVLTPQETEKLFDNIRELRQQAISIIFISHKLDEVLAISDRVTVLRGGRTIDTVQTAQVSGRELARMMIGHFLEPVAKPARSTGPLGLVVKGLTLHTKQDVLILDKVNLEVERGEILGIAGIDGNGQTALVDAISGVRPARQGEISISGTPTSALRMTPRTFASLGGAYVPQDRERTGVVLDFTVAENIMLKKFSVAPLVKWGFLQKRRILQLAQALLNEFDVRPPDPSLITRVLSGGNLQKVIVAREISEKPGVILVAYPTRGLDIAATEFVHQQLVLQRSEGAAIVLISNELDELLALSDRLAVMHRGRIVAVVKPASITAEEIGLLMMGQTASHL